MKGAWHCEALVTDGRNGFGVKVFLNGKWLPAVRLWRAWAELYRAAAAQAEVTVGLAPVHLAGESGERALARAWEREEGLEREEKATVELEEAAVTGWQEAREATIRRPM